MCCKCEAVDDLSVDCEQCGKRTYVFWQYPVGEFISGCLEHLQIRFMLSHTNLEDTTQFLLRRFLELRWVPQLRKDGTEILSMTVKNFYFLDY